MIDLKLNRRWAAAFIVIGMLGLVMYIMRQVLFLEILPPADTVPQPPVINGHYFVWSWLTEFLYVTNIGFILFCVWLVCAGTGFLTGNKLICKICFNHYVVLFICALQMLVFFVALIFEFVGGFNYGWFNGNFHSWRQLIEGMLIHYVYTVFAVGLWFRAKTNIKLLLRRCWSYYVFFVCWFAAALLCGQFLTPVEWYPYPTFDGRALWRVVFGDAPFSDGAGAVLLVIAANVLLGLFFLAINFLLITVQNKKQNQLKS